MKKAFSLSFAALLSVCLALGLSSCLGKDSGSLEFLSGGDGTCIVSGIGTVTDNDIVIPTTSPAGDTVVGIGESAFAYNHSITSVRIPGSVKHIGRGAFQCASGLASVSILNGVSSIDDSAFYFGTELLEVEIPDSVTRIGDNAFLGCQALSSADIGKGVFSIGEYAFSKCPRLARIEVDTDNTAYKSIDGSLYTHDGKVLVRFAVGKNDLSVTVRDGVETIGSGAFDEAAMLESAVIPNSVKVIGSNAFGYCPNLKSIEIPDSVSSIGSFAFVNCENLVKASFGGGVVTIGQSAFSGCSKLANLALPNSLKHIEKSAFSGCTGLASVAIPDNVESIGEYAFNDCINLTSAVIGKSVAQIGLLAFGSCDHLYKLTNNSNLPLKLNSNFDYGNIEQNLKVLVDKDGNKSYNDTEDTQYIETEDNFLFEEKDEVYALIAYLGNADTVTLPEDIDGNKYRISRVLGARNIIISGGVEMIEDRAFCNNLLLESVVIGDGIKSIGEETFAYCIALSEVTIGESVESIGRSAFKGCGALEFLRLSSGLLEIGYEAFSGCTNLKSVVIPNGTVKIDDGAFANSALNCIVIPISIEEIGDRVFEKYLSIEKFYYGGTAEDLLSISFGIGNEDLLKAERYYYSESKPDAEGNFWHYDVSGKIVIW